MKKTTKTTVKDNVKDLKAASVITEIGDLQVNIQNTLAGISAAITGKLEQLKNTESAIGETETRLKELFSIEKEYLDHEEIVKEHLEEQAFFEKEMELRKIEWAEQEATRAKKWQREEEEHVYNFEQTRKKQLDTFNVEVSERQRAEKIRCEELTKSWSNREQELKARENELVDLKKAVSDFDNRLKNEVSKAEAIATATTKKQYEHQIQLLMKDMESEKNMSDAKIQSLQIQVGQMHEQIVELNKQLVAARNDAKEVTAQALQSASGRQVADALARVVDNTKDSSKK